MTIRRATQADVATLVELWEAFEREVPEPPHRKGAEDDRAEIPGYLDDGLALLAEDGGKAIGYALARIEPPRICYLSDVYVAPGARGHGIATALVAQVADWARGRDVDVVTLEVAESNSDALALYVRLGFAVERRTLVVSLDALEQRVGGAERGPSHGSIHIQTDDLEAVVRAVRQYVPRLPGGSRGSVVAPPRNGWTAVHDELCDREPAMLRRLALELSDRMGAVVLAIGIEHGDVVRYVLFERGSIVDEYLSVPEYHGPLPPGDVIGLGANPTVVARLTGADPARVKELARTGRAPADLPPAAELLAALTAAMGVEGADVGQAAARDIPGAVVLDRAQSE